ncbi:CHAT domain-containing protein [Myxosarcina sp. GI1]|uniref:CHAT domain-containing protein n=1 Tax=Myxosarcina sp. GI1 TaxID=1541065 RepID=UPI00056233F2|nr:CHAT domain-containing protein [Myxosarcina sp. GI1]
MGTNYIVNNFKILVLVVFSMLFAIPSGRTEENVSSRTKNEAEHQADLGAYHWQHGDAHQAIAAWKKEAEIYRQQKLERQEAETVLKIAQSYTSLGQSDLAIFLLEKLIANDKITPSIRASAWEKLGNAYTKNGEFTKAEDAYKTSLGANVSLSSLNNLVLLLKKQYSRAQLQADSSRKEEAGKYKNKAENYHYQALKYARKALSIAQNQQSSSAVRALIEWGQLSPTKLSSDQIARGRAMLDNLPPSRTKVFLAINWAKLDSNRATYWLERARKIARTLGDARAESFALLELGVLAERSGNLSKALEYAQIAQLEAQSEFSYDSLYPAQWLAARIYRKRGAKASAISNYREAIASLDVLNSSSDNINLEQRLDFESQVEPLYREMLEMLLTPASQKSELIEALSIFDKLRLAQLQNYFGDKCFEIEEESLTKKDVLSSNAVLFNSIILNERTHLILELPDGTLHHQVVNSDKAEIDKMATEWYESLQETNTYRFKRQSQKFYNLLVRPFESQLASVNPAMTIFIHDGILRNLPMAALHDGQKYFAQKWISISSVGLNFNSATANEKNLEAIAFGLSEKKAGWSRLVNVSDELDSVTRIVGGKEILNQDFTATNFAEKLKQEEYSIVHLASHGYFGGIAENSFILAYDKPISALELETSLSQSQEKIALLVLSACETAISSDRSALGLAGVGLRSGVDSVLGSFWQVRDAEQTELMESFYSYFQKADFNRAKALQNTQVELIERQAHPSSWAALNLIGS